MTRRRSLSFSEAQRDLYLTARTVGDVNAARRGRLGQRLLRRGLHRKEIGLLRKWRIW